MSTPEQTFVTCLPCANSISRYVLARVAGETAAWMEALMTYVEHAATAHPAELPTPDPACTNCQEWEIVRRKVGEHEAVAQIYAHENALHLAHHHLVNILAAGPSSAAAPSGRREVIEGDGITLATGQRMPTLPEMARKTSQSSADVIANLTPYDPKS